MKILHNHKLCRITLNFLFVKSPGASGIYSCFSERPESLRPNGLHSGTHFGFCSFHYLGLGCVFWLTTLVLFNFTNYYYFLIIIFILLHIWPSDLSENMKSLGQDTNDNQVTI